MNRRSFLTVGCASATVALAGCLDTLGELSLQTPVTIRIENETETNHNVTIVAYALEDDRQTYDEEVTAPPGQAVSVGHLSSFDQYVKFELVEDGEVQDEEETLIGERTQSLVARIDEAGISLEMNQREP